MDIFIYAVESVATVDIHKKMDKPNFFISFFGHSHTQLCRSVLTIMYYF